MTRLIKAARKTPVLQASDFGCLRGVPGINITRGCLHSCVYCYARGFPEAPPRGEVHLYANLPEVLEGELARKRRLPRWVAFSTASDAFQALDEVLAVTYEAMSLLLRRGIGISFLTKGEVPEEFLRLFQRHPHLVSARVGLTTLDESLARMLEPQAPPPVRRLAAISRLRAAGVQVSARLDPVIAGLTDHEQNLKALFAGLRRSGVQEAAFSYLVLRPAIMNQVLAELPGAISRRLLRPYLGQPWQQVITSARTRLLPRMWRARHSRLVKEWAKEFSLTVRLCGCKNPDLDFEFCQPWRVDGEAGEGSLPLPLFRSAGLD